MCHNPMVRHYELKFNVHVLNATRLTSITLHSTNGQTESAHNQKPHPSKREQGLGSNCFRPLTRPTCQGPIVSTMKENI